MNKKSLSVILLALTAGTFLGYMGKALTLPSSVAGEKQTGVNPIIPPRFGSPASFSSPSRQSNSTHSDQVEMPEPDASLKRYMRMSANELYDELEKWKKQELYIDYQYTSNGIGRILIAHICARLGQEFPRQTLSHIKDRKELAPYRYSILEAWGEKNPEAAMAYCQEHMDEDSARSSSMVYQYVTLLANSSPEKAIDYLLARPSEENCENLELLLAQIAKKNPEKIAAILEKIHPTISHHKMMSAGVASLWAKTDWNATEQWIKTLPEESRSERMNDAVSALPREEALKKLDLLDEKNRESALFRLSGSLFDESPVKALEFIQANSTEEQAASLIENNGFFFNTRDAEFVDYLEKMQTSPLRDNLLEKVVCIQSSFNDSDSRFFDPKMEDALSLADKIGSAEKKEKTLQIIMNSWMRKEPEKVKSWVETSSFSDENKKEFTQWCNNIIEADKENG